MANTILYDGDSERLDSEAEVSRITRSGGGILSPSASRSEYTRYDHSFVPGERVRGWSICGRSITCCMMTGRIRL